MLVSHNQNSCMVFVNICPGHRVHTTSTNMYIKNCIIVEAFENISCIWECTGENVQNGLCERGCVRWDMWEGMCERVYYQWLGGNWFIRWHNKYILLFNIALMITLKPIDRFWYLCHANFGLNWMFVCEQVIIVIKYVLKYFLIHICMRLKLCQCLN